MGSSPNNNTLKNKDIIVRKPFYHVDKLKPLILQGKKLVNRNWPKDKKEHWKLNCPLILGLKIMTKRQSQS